MRRAIFVIHQWIGLAIGIYIIPLFLTGVFLILNENQIAYFRDDPMMRVAVSGNQLSLSTLEQTVARVYPKYPIREIHESCPRGCSLDFSLWRHKNERWDILVDPYTGRVLKKSVWQLSPIGLLYAFHAQLFGGAAGAWINYIFGAMVFLQSLTGLYLWPGWHNFASGFGVRFQGSNWRVNFDLHKLIGICSFPFIAFIAFTGVIGMVLPGPDERVMQVQPTAGPLSLDFLVNKARTVLAGQVTVVYPPETPQMPLKVRFAVTDDPDPWGWSYVLINQYSGKVLVVHDERQSSLYRRFWIFLYPLHIGSVGGLTLRYLYCVFALIPIPLYATGLLMWLNTLKRETEIRVRRTAT